MTKKNVYTVYVLIVCLISVTVSTVLVGSISYNLLGAVLPHYTVSSYTYDNFVSNDQFLESLQSNDPCRNNNKLKCRVLPTKEEEITALREKRLGEELQKRRREHFQNIIENAPYLILFLLVGFFHWRLFRTIKE